MATAHLLCRLSRRIGDSDKIGQKRKTSDKMLFVERKNQMKRVTINVLMTAVAAFGWMAGAAPSVEITEAWQANPGSGIVDFTYTVGDLGGNPYDLVITVGAKGATPVVVTNECIAEGTMTTNINYRQLLGKTYPNVTLYASLKEHLPYVQLWENGPFWAECNVGATKPEDTGYYFWWGDTVGYKRNANDDGWISVKDSTSFLFRDSKIPTYYENNDKKFPTYNKNNAQLLAEGYIDSTGNLVAAHDAATVHLGVPWRMPTLAELRALVDNCTVTWTTRNGVVGRLVTGKGAYASKSIFLPATGYGNGADLCDLGSSGCYWSSTSDSDNTGHARVLFIFSSYNSVHTQIRGFGQSVRPLRELAQ